MRTAPFSVLAIDDSLIVLKAIQLCLRSTGWTVTTTLFGDEGVMLAEKMHADVILCDSEMPRCSGKQVVKMLKENPVTAGIPVILMTGFSEAKMSPPASWAGFLQKPFGPKEVLAAIESASGQTAPPRTAGRC